MRDFVEIPDLPLSYKLKGYIVYSQAPVVDIPKTYGKPRPTTTSKLPSTGPPSINSDNYPAIGARATISKADAKRCSSGGGGSAKLGQPSKDARQHKKSLAKEEQEPGEDDAKDGSPDQWDTDDTYSEAAYTTADEYEDVGAKTAEEMKLDARRHYLQVAQEVYEQCVPVYTAKDDVEELARLKSWLDEEIQFFPTKGFFDD